MQFGEKRWKVAMWRRLQAYQLTNKFCERMRVFQVEICEVYETVGGPIERLNYFEETKKYYPLQHT